MLPTACKSLSLSKLGQLDVVNIENDFAQAKVCLFGGQMLSFIPKADNRERLWLSDKAIVDGSKAIRGGVPVCWPWFSDTHARPELSLPSHGYVRTQNWQLLGAEEVDAGTKLVLAPQTTVGKGFDADADLTLTLLIGSSLELSLGTTNKGTAAFNITCALHTYFAIEHIDEIELTGISGQYKDKTQNWQVFDTPLPYYFDKETDRIHMCQQEQVAIKDVSAETLVGSKGHDSLVVWNPWSDLSHSMRDMPDLGYQKMVCVETAVTGGIEIAPGQTHQLTQQIS